jgi:antitoxin component YwqK of YwqJK toxin-antitoxin module
LRTYQALANNTAMTDLNIAEIPHENGEIRFRYARKMSPDGSRWIRHGLFVAYHPNGAKASEGRYEEGVEQGVWRDYHENGQPAAEGQYDGGAEVGQWRYWNADGQPEVKPNDR